MTHSTQTATRSGLESFLTLLGIGLLAMLTVAVCVGFIAQSYWAWFVVPLGAPALGFWQAAGIAIGARVVGRMSLARRRDAAHEDRVGAQCVDFICATGLAWCVGAVIHALAF